MDRSHQKTALVIGPLPPAIGGIATIVGSIRDHAGGAEGLAVIDSSKPSTFIAAAAHPVMLAWKLLMGSLSLNRGKVLMFSGAYRSFWEKCMWSTIVRLSGSKPIVVMVDGHFPTFYNRLPSVLKKVAAYFMSHLDILGVQSESWKEYFSGIFPRANIRIVAGGVDTEYFSPAPAARESGAIRILYVGWMIEQKGIDDLLKAAQILHQEERDFAMRLVGPTFGRDEAMRSMIRELGLATKVKLIGAIACRAKLREEYRAADMFAFPSHYEGFPVALLEAISSGLPCLGTTVGGIPDILDQGRCGILVQPRSPKELAGAMRTLLENPELRKEYGQRARLRAVENHSLHESLQSYCRLLSIGNP